MTLYAIGDIHGCWTALQTLLEVVPVQPDDQIVTLGDYIDRGPDSKSVLDWLVQRHAKGRLFALRGNHEVMMLDALQNRIPMHVWLQFGGQEALDSYSPDGSRGRPEDLLLEHIRFLTEKLQPYYETDTHLFVHATLDRRYPVHSQPDDALYWNRFETQKPHPSGKVIICGHTAQKSGVPADLGFAVCIDTWVYGRGWLTCLDVQSGQYWQANQQGEVRSGWLSSRRGQVF